MGDYTPAWLDRLQAALTVPRRICLPIASVQWGFGTRRWPNPVRARVLLGVEPGSLYMNGILFVSIRLPFFVNLGIRWGDETRRASTLQVHIGWRPVDGAPVAVFRVQNDFTRQGGLALGFEDGPL